MEQVVPGKSKVWQMQTSLQRLWSLRSEQEVTEEVVKEAVKK